MQQPEIRTLERKKLAGMKLIMNHMENKTGLLWKSFMPLRNSVPHKVNNLLYSLQVFPSGYFNQFNPATYFEKWALVEVSSWIELPEGMEKFELQGGSFAVFQHKGMDPSIFNYIYSEWLPNSAFQLDDRPHFEILGEKYRNGDPNSEEEIWIPVSKK
jgi:AraC family transcriptional regulator